MIGIYIITNKTNGKMYIGQQIDIDKRIKEHFWKAFCKKDCQYKCILHAALRKYGIDTFEWRVLEECREDDLDSLEIYYIEKYNTLTPNGYNILSGGQKYRCSKEKEYSICKKCNCKITKGACYCEECLHTIRKKQVLDSCDRDVFKELIRNYSFEYVGRLLHITGKAVAKRCMLYNLPSKKKEITGLSQEEWDVL